MSNPDCTAGCGFICTCGDIDYSRENEFAAETTRLRQQIEIAVRALGEYADQNQWYSSSGQHYDWKLNYNSGTRDGHGFEAAKQALAQIKDMEK